MESTGLALGAIVIAGVGAQWLASRLRIPSILFLLVAGVLVGPVLDIVEPQALFGDTLFPAVSLAVGILLFEGGLGLRFGRLREGRGAVLRLVTLGALVTWVVGGVAAWWLLDLSPGQAALLGGVVIVSGPTVVLPLLAQLRLRNPLDTVARWEGIVIDPVGATVGVVVVGVLLGTERGLGHPALEVLTTVAAGAAIGVAAAALMVVIVERHLVGDALLNSVTLMVIVIAFGCANAVRPEAGLFATAFMGAALANQRRVSLRQIARFEEDLGLLLLAVLFVVLGAQLDLDALWEQLVPALALSAVLILVARPLAVAVSTVGTRLGWRERVFLMALAPRGIVAASVSSLFALELADASIPMPELVPATYVVIFVTVALATVVSGPLSRRLGLAKPDPRGVAVVGDDRFAHALADQLVAEGVPVLLISGQGDDRLVTDGGLLTYQGHLDSEELDEAVDEVGVRQAIVLSSSEELTSYAVPRLAELLDRANVFRLPDRTPDQEHAREADAVAEQPFRAGLTQADVAERLQAGASLQAVDAAAAPPSGDDHLVLVSISPDGRASIAPARGRAGGGARAATAPGARLVVLGSLAGGGAGEPV
jgi:NhaP-type Na+/H+ or K+/H+ antiporter